MKTTDLFKINKQASRLNESLSKTFGQKLNLENFDLHQLQDARNKIRTQLSQIKSDSGFNENLENDAYHKAQFMLDTLNAEIMEREEFVAEVTEDDDEADQKNEYFQYDTEPKKDRGPRDQGHDELARREKTMGKGGLAKDARDYKEKDKYGDAYKIKGPKGKLPEDSVEEEAPPTAKGERMVKHIKQGYADDGKVTDKEKGIAYATAWKQHNKEKNESVQTEQDAETVADFQKRGGEIQYGKPQKGPRRSGTSMASRHIGGSGDRMKASRTGLGANTQGRPVTGISKKTSESNETGENMTKLREGEIQQASAIVTAKTMVDRVGRWIEELSGMENDTLLQLGDSIRDEMSSELAKTFISTVAPAIQQALQNLKDTRETLATGVRTLTGEEQGAEMLGADPTAAAPDMAAEPDAMNAAAPEMDAADDFGDEFAAADAAAGGAEAAGREQRESIQYQNRLLKVLAG